MLKPLRTHRGDEMKKNIFGFVLAFCLVINLTYGLLNPAPTYCEQLGYEYFINQTEEGEVGFCKISDDIILDSWDFLKGKVGKEYSYCKLHGYDIKNVNNSDVCPSIYFGECAVCVLDNGTEIEVTKLMNLSLEESFCGDGSCAIGEDYQTCSEDCPSGSMDAYCDGVEDGICDPDCTPETDPDCVTQTTLITKCGNGMCDKDENYGSCPQDCESGRRDGYCDGVKDGRCDPDCPEGRDADCKGGVNKFLIIIILLIVGILAFFIFRGMKHGEYE